MLENESYASTFGDPQRVSVPGRHAGQARCAAERLLRHRPRLERQLHLDRLRPAAECRRTRPTATRSRPSPATTASARRGRERDRLRLSGQRPNIGTQLSAAHLSWKALHAGHGQRSPSARRQPAAIRRSTSPTPTQVAESGDGYATRHDPFVYFRFDHRPARVLRRPRGRARLTDRRHAGRGAGRARRDWPPTSSRPRPRRPSPSSHPTCAATATTSPASTRPSGSSAGADVDRFLQTWVPKITGSPAFRQVAACSRSPSTRRRTPTPPPAAARRPVRAPSTPGVIGAGGGRVGALLISPYIKPGSVSHRPYNHYSSLATWEQLFHLRRLAYARTVPNSFGADVFTRYAP